jgi:hypothetical protein
MTLSLVRVWVGAALRQVVPVIGVCVLGWEPVTVLLFYWLDAALRVPVGKALAVFGSMPLLAVTIMIVALLIKAGQDGLDLLLRAVPSTLQDAALLAAAIAMQVSTSLRRLHARQPIPPDRKAFETEAAFRFALLLMRTLLLAPIVMIAIAAPEIAQVAVIVLAVALTVYDANPQLFLRMMELLFKSNPET